MARNEDPGKASDKADEVNKAPEKGAEAAKEEARDGLEKLTGTKLDLKRQAAEMNMTLSGHIGGEKFTITGLEGYDGKGAAASEKEAAKAQKERVRDALGKEPGDQTADQVDLKGESKPADTGKAYATPEGKSAGDTKDDKAGKAAPEAESAKAPADAPAEPEATDKTGDKPPEPAEGDASDDKMGGRNEYKPRDAYKVDQDSIVTDDEGNVTKVTITGPDGTPVTYQKVEGQWGVTVNGTTKPAADMGIQIASIKAEGEKPNATVTMNTTAEGPPSTEMAADGTTKYTNQYSEVEAEVKPDGSTTTYSRNPLGEVQEVAISKPGSPVTEIHKPDKTDDSKPGDLSAYEIKDKDGHTETIKPTKDGVSVSKGDKTESYPGAKADVAPDGSVKVTDSKSGVVRYERAADGTTIERDKDGRVTETTTADGSTTTYKRDKKGELTDVEVKNSQGEVTEAYWKDGDTWYSSRQVQEDGVGVVEDVAVDNGDGKMTVVKPGGTEVERKADGTEEMYDARGEYKDSKADEMVSKYDEVLDTMDPPLSEKERAEKEAQFKKDLAEIDKLPPEQRDKVYAGIDKILTANTDGKTNLTPEQRADIATSLAHQIADPESIRQGDRNSCVPANAEQTMAKDHPDAYAETVAQLATEGKIDVKTPDGKTKTIEVQKEYVTDKDGNPVKDKDGKPVLRLSNGYDSYGDRSPTSEIFQNAAANAALPDGQTYMDYPPNDAPRTTDKDQQPKPSEDTGERIEVTKDANGNPKNPPEIKPWEGLDAADQQRILNTFAPEDNYTTKPIESPDDLVAAYKENGGPPLNVGIHLDSAKYKDGASDTPTPGGNGKHAINVSHIDTSHKPPLVYYDDPAGGPDHTYPNGTGVPIKDFVASMQGDPDPKVKGETGVMSAVVKTGNADS